LILTPPVGATIFPPFLMIDAIPVSPDYSNRQHLFPYSPAKYARPSLPISSRVSTGSVPFKFLTPATTPLLPRPALLSLKLLILSESISLQSVHAERGQGPFPYLRLQAAGHPSHCGLSASHFKGSSMDSCSPPDLAGPNSRPLTHFSPRSFRFQEQPSPCVLRHRNPFYTLLLHYRRLFSGTTGEELQPLTILTLSIFFEVPSSVPSYSSDSFSGPAGPFFFLASAVS